MISRVHRIKEVARRIELIDKKAGRKVSVCGNVPSSGIASATYVNRAVCAYANARINGSIRRANKRPTR